VKKKYWPFEVLPPEQRAPLHSDQIRFLENAYRDGYQPYLDGQDFIATNANSRSGSIIKRASRSRWEVVLSEANQRAVSLFLDDFCCASNAVLDWLRGGEAKTIIVSCAKHIIVPPGATSSHTIYAEP
jgi:hypothetical protein